ncbi:MAG: MarR family transcriptional regulator [Polyangiaceae bacterium]
MRPLIFTLKRFVLIAGRCARKLAEFAGLTPARLDLLLQLRDGPRWQSELVLDMCVHPSVVSRMLKALEALDLVRRFKDEANRRQRIVWLTDRALIAFQHLWEAEFPDIPDLNIQGSAEEAIATHWHPRAEQDGFAIHPIDTVSDRRPFLRRMLSTVLATDFSYWVPGDADASPRPARSAPDDVRGPLVRELVISHDRGAPPCRGDGTPIAIPTGYDEPWRRRR